MQQPVPFPTDFQEFYSSNKCNKERTYEQPLLAENENENYNSISNWL